MAITLPDVVLRNQVFQDIYAATGITVGTPVMIQNKGTNPCQLVVASSQPPIASTLGYLLPNLQSCIITNATEGLWGFGQGPISVQVYAQ